MPDKKGQNLADLIYGQPTHGDSPGMQAGGIPKIVKAGKGAVSRLIEEMRQINPFEAKRLERMADEVPNLENLYKEEALKSLLRGDNAKGVMTIRPEDFEKFATPLPDPLSEESIRNIKNLRKVGSFNDVPWLELNKKTQGSAELPFFSGHEGRHRMRALAEQGQPTAIVQMSPRAALREPFPRSSRKDYLDALNAELELSGELAIPQPDIYNLKQSREIKRPPVIMPTVYKKGGEARMDKGGAAFGVFPQMKPRRSRQDPEAAKQVPVDLARGFAAGALGMPGDVESLIRLLPGLSEETILPTSEDILKRIPGGSDTPASRAASGLGILGGGFYTGPGSAARAVSSVAGALPKAARDFVQAAGQPAVNVIKPKGGNWLTGSVEKALAELKPRGPTHRDEALILGGEAARLADTPEGMRQIASNAALSNWVDRNLANYVKKEMATSEDPVRKLIEETGVSHIPIEETWHPTSMEARRKAAGFPAEGFANKRLNELPEGADAQTLDRLKKAEEWESRADETIRNLPVKEWMKLDPQFLAENPWMSKVDPDTMAYQVSFPTMRDDLRFDHIIDVLREDLATGRIRPEQLNKVSMEQAVRRTYEYDQELAKKMQEATAAARADLPVYKEYPEKYRWIELNRPGAFASESEAMGHSVRGYEPPKGHPDWTPASGDSGSPSYGHGGWEAIKSGKAKVYSLVDEKGQPHVTVEVGPPKANIHGGADDAAFAKITEEADRLFGVEAEGTQEYMDFVNKNLDLLHKDQPPAITQIKGKQNAAPKKEYLPFVQDFVKSGQWSDVGDITNANLEKANWTIKPQEVEQLKSMGIDVPDYVTPDERLNLIRKVRGKSPEDMKHGGSVHISNNPDTMRLELAGGGSVDRLTPQDMLYLTSHPDFAKMSAQQQREAVVNMGDRELSERMKGKMAGGGEVTADDLILEERPL